MAMHIYFVEWSAPIPRHSKNMRVRAQTKQSAINKAKERLGKKVKEQHLHHFDAWRVKPYRKKA